MTCFFQKTGMKGRKYIGCNVSHDWMALCRGTRRGQEEANRRIRTTALSCKCLPHPGRSTTMQETFSLLPCHKVVQVVSGSETTGGGLHLSVKSLRLLNPADLLQPGFRQMKCTMSCLLLQGLGSRHSCIKQTKQCRVPHLNA